MKIHKILNNNFVIVKEEHEMVIMGLGIAFNKRVGDAIEDYEIDKIFYLSNSDVNRRLQELLIDVPLDIVRVSEEIITQIKLEIGRKVNDLIYVTLIDHINSAISRNRNGINISNNLLLDIQRFYPQEYVLGLAAMNKINQTFNIELHEDEAGFIALHIVNATMNESDNVKSYQITQLMKEIIAIVRRYYEIDFDTQSLYYYRFVNHLRFLGQRLFVDTIEAPSTQYEDLLVMIRSKYHLAYQCSVLINTFLEETYHLTLGSEELMYLTIHIERIVDEYNNKRRK